MTDNVDNRDLRRNELKFSEERNEQHQNSIPTSQDYPRSNNPATSISQGQDASQPPFLPNMDSPKGFPKTPPKQGHNGNSNKTHSDSLLSLRPIPLRDRISSVDRKHMLLHMHIGDEYEDNGDDYDSDDESSIDNMEDSPFLTGPTNRSQGQSLRLPLDTFSRPRTSKMPSRSKETLTSPIQPVNNESDFTSDDESSYFSQQYNQRDKNQTPFLDELDRRSAAALRSYSSSSSPACGLPFLNPLPNQSTFNTQNRKHFHNQSSASLSLSDSSDDSEQHNSGRFVAYSKRVVSPNVTNYVRSSPNQDYDNNSGSSNTNSEIFRASSNSYDLEFQEHVSTSHRPRNPHVREISGEESSIRKGRYINQKRTGHSQSPKFQNKKHERKRWKHQDNNHNSPIKQTNLRPLNKSPPYLYSKMEENVTQKNGKPIQQPKFIHYPTQTYSQGAQTPRVQAVPNEFFVSTNQSPLPNSLGSATIGTESSTDSHDHHASSYALSKTPSSPFTAFSSSRVTLNMEYSSDEGSDYMDPEESFTSDAMEHFARNLPMHKINNFLPSEHLNDSSKPLSSKRWLMVFFISALNFLSEWICFSAAPISTILINENRALIPPTLISAFLFGKCFTTTQESYIFEKLGVRRTVMLGSGLLWLSTLVKATRNHSIAIPWIYIRFFIAGMSQPLYQHAVGAIASSWFPETQRDDIMSFMLNSKRMGICFSFLYGTKAVVTTDEIPNYFRNFGLLTALICLGICMLFDDKPQAYHENNETGELSYHSKSSQHETIFRESIDEVEAAHGPNMMDNDQRLTDSVQIRTATPSGQSTGTPGLYHGHLILTSTGEGTLPMDLHQKEKVPLLNRSEQYGSTSLYQNTSPRLFVSKQNSADGDGPIFPTVQNSPYLNVSQRRSNNNEIESSTTNRSSTSRLRSKDVFVFVNACLSCPGFSYSLISFIPASIVILSLTANMDLMITKGKQVNVENRRLGRALLGSMFQAILLLSSSFSAKKNKPRSSYSSILGFHILGTFALSACIMSLDSEKGWDERFSLLIVALLVGPLQSISTEFGVSIANPISKHTVFIVQEFFSDVLCAFFIPLFQILGSVGVSSTLDNAPWDSSNDPKRNYFAVSLEVLIGLHIFSALFFATFQRKYNRVTTRKDASSANYLYVQNEEKNHSSSSLDRSEDIQEGRLSDEESDV